MCVHQRKDEDHSILTTTDNAHSFSMILTMNLKSFGAIFQSNKCAADSETMTFYYSFTSTFNINQFL